MSDTPTPGEWYNKGKDCGSMSVIANKEDEWVCMILCKSDYEEANARLIVASKELLAYAEAEQAAEDHRAECIYCSVGGCIQWEKMREDAELLRIAALAKARGEQE